MNSHEPLQFHRQQLLKLLKHWDKQAKDYKHLFKRSKDQKWETRRIEIVQCANELRMITGLWPKEGGYKCKIP